MAVKRGGLGHGLDSLIPNTSGAESVTQKTEVKTKVVEKVVEKIVEKPVETKIKISKIEPNKEQPRKL